MFGKAILGSMRSTAKRFARADQGNIAMIFAITLVPLLAIVGAAVDYTRASAARSAMQSALDTAALMISRDVAANPSLSADAVQNLAKQYFGALYHNSDANSVAVKAVYTVATSNKTASISIDGSGIVPTDFMKLVGFPKLDIGANSKTAWGNTRMRVAMVLDNTGSMAQNGKMPAMQTAAKNMVDTLAGYNKQTGDVFISLVPFAKNVNLGSSFNQSYIKWSSPTGTSNPDTWDENNGVCSVGSYKTQTSCQAKYVCSISGKTSQNSCTSAGTCSNSNYGDQSSCTSAGTCSKSQYTTQSTCTSKNGKWTASNYTWTPGVWAAGKWTPNDHSKWSGCVMDRDQDYDIQNAAPVAGDTGAVSTLFPAQEYIAGSTNYCKSGSSAYLQPVIPMTNVWETLKTAITDMDPTGGTNQAIGIAWGWQSLSTTNGPIAALPKESNYIYQDYLVVLSDGLNTQDRWPSYGDGSTQNTCAGNVPCIDARQEKLCDAIKKDNITIFTIQVNISSKDPESQVLKGCASPGTNNFQMITQTDQTASAFQNILTQITKLRIAQ
jgi:Flp pilus assembly protein TadG